MTPAQVWQVEALLALGLLGAVIGSFLNVCIYRLPLGLSVVRPGSSCPRCRSPIRPWHNIPIASWFWLRGRCAACGGRISPRYPLIEAANVALWLLAAARFGLTAQLLVVLPLFSTLLVLFFTDWDHQLLPDRATLPLAVAGLALAPWNARLDYAPWWLGLGSAWSRLAAATSGAAVGFGVFLALALTWKLLFRRDAMGGGDLKLMLGVGAFLGLSGVLVTVFLGALTGALFSLPFLLRGRWTMRRELPFGCFLCPAALIAALYGNEILAWYLNLLVVPTG